MTVDPFFRQVAVSTQLHRRTFWANVIDESQMSTASRSSLQSHEVPLVHRTLTSSSVVLLHSSFPAHSEEILSCQHPRPFVLPSCMIVGVNLHVLCFCVLATTSCSSMHRQHRTRPCVTCPLHGSPNAFGNQLS